MADKPIPVESAKPSLLDALNDAAAGYDASNEPREFRPYNAAENIRSSAPLSKRLEASGGRIADA